MHYTTALDLAVWSGGYEKRGIRRISLRRGWHPTIGVRDGAF
jgi:hypothetical protein